MKTLRRARQQRAIPPAMSELDEQAESERARLLAEQQRVIQQLEAGRARLAELDAAQTARDVAARDATETVTARRAELERASMTARIAEQAGHSAHVPRLTAHLVDEERIAQKLLTDAESACLKLQAEHRQAHEQDTEERARIAATLTENETRLVALEQQLATLSQVQESFFAEQGEQLLQAALAELAERELLLDEVKKEVARLEAERRGYAAKAADDLRPWPDLQARLITVSPCQDATTDVLEAARAFFTVLLERGPEGEQIPAAVFQQAGLSGDLGGMLATDERTLYPALLRGHARLPTTLADKRDKVEKLLAAYVARKKLQEVEKKTR